MATKMREFGIWMRSNLFGNDVACSRRELAMSRQQLADLCEFEAKIDVQSVEAGEGMAELSLSAFLKMCAVLGLTPGLYFDQMELALSGIVSDAIAKRYRDTSVS